MPRVKKFSDLHFFLSKKLPFLAALGMETVFFRERNCRPKIFPLQAKFFHITGIYIPSWLKQKPLFSLQEYIFLQGGNILPSVEKFAADNFFLEKKQFPIPSAARNGSFFERKKWRSANFFMRGIIFPAYRMYFPFQLPFD